MLQVMISLKHSPFFSNESVFLFSVSADDQSVIYTALNVFMTFVSGGLIDQTGMTLFSLVLLECTQFIYVHRLIRVNSVI